VKELVICLLFNSLAWFTCYIHASLPKLCTCDAQNNLHRLRYFLIITLCKNSILVWTWS